MLLGFMIVLGVAAAAWTTRPLWLGAVDGGLRRRTANVLAYRQRQLELEADLSAGLLDADTAVALKSELDARLLRDAEAVDAESRSGARAHWAAGALVLLVLAGGFVGYFTAGSWRTQQLVVQGPQADPSSAPESVDAMVGALAQRLQDNPNDVDGWALLGRSYFVMGRYTDAAAAYARGSRIVDAQEPDLLVNEGEALALARDRDLQGRPAQLFDAALALDPGHGKALWYAGLAAQQAGQAELAGRHWALLAQQELPDEMRQVLEERLGQVDGSGAVRKPAQAAAAAADTPGSSDGAVRLRLAVSVSPDLRAQVPPDAVLFVFARAAGGPPMPLAVYRGRASELPRQIELNDAMAMQPGLELSGFDRWDVVARISRSGGAQAVSGDLQGSLTVAREALGDAALAVQIDTVVP